MTTSEGSAAMTTSESTTTSDLTTSDSTTTTTTEFSTTSPSVTSDVVTIQDLSTTSTTTAETATAQFTTVEAVTTDETTTVVDAVTTEGSGESAAATTTNPPQTNSTSTATTTDDVTTQPDDVITTTTTEATVEQGSGFGESTVSTTTVSPTTQVTAACPAFSELVDGRCLSQMNFEISLTFNLEFNIDLKNPNTEFYQTFSNNVTETLNAIIASTNLLVSGSTTLVWTFSPGSIIAKATQVPLINATSEDEVQAEIETADTSNVPLPQLTEIKFQGVNECEVAGVNDCAPEGSECQETRNAPGFACSCQPFYVDTNVTYPGRNCVPDPCFTTYESGELYCRDRGVCTAVIDPSAINSVEATCLCSSWYTGPRCQQLSTGMMSAVVVIPVLVVVIFIVMVTVCLRHRSHSKSAYLQRGDAERQFTMLPIAAPSGHQNMEALNLEEHRTAL